MKNRLIPVEKKTKRIRVLIVDDTSLVRRLLSDVIRSDAELELVGAASNGKQGLELVKTLNPDVVVLDVEMPEMDGIEMLRDLRKTHSRLPVIMHSSLTERGQVLTFQALANGANDYIAKPSKIGNSSAAREFLIKTLPQKIKILARKREIVTNPVGAPLQSKTIPSQPIARELSCIEVVAIGTSTGGPNALRLITSQLPEGFQIPVLIVIHMPASVVPALVARMQVGCKLPIGVATEAEPLLPGHIYVAPGNRHMKVQRPHGAASLTLSDEAPENSCRPSVDVLFRSVADAYGMRGLGIVLTGMGEDGLKGAESIRAKGGHVWVQDEQSSVVWGMPRSIVNKELADRVLPLPHIAQELTVAAAKACPSLVDSFNLMSGVIPCRS